MMSWFFRQSEARRLLRELAAARRRIESLEEELRSYRVHASAREDALVDRILQAVKLAGIARQVEEKLAPPPGTVETPLSAYEEAVRDAFRAEAQTLGKPLAEADAVFERWRAGAPTTALVEDDFPAFPEGIA